MSDLDRILKTAIRAGWRTWFLAYAILLVQWLVYLWFIRVKPAWFSALWGSSDWASIQSTWINATIFYKLVCWFFAFILIWLMLWRKMLTAEKKEGKK